MAKEMADFCTATYLKAFRKCPENPSMSLDEWRSKLWKNALPEDHQHLTYEIYEQWLKYRYHFLELPSELVHMLRQLRKNYLLVIITNGPSNAQWEKIHKLGLNMGKNALFDCILVSADVGIEKPDARIFHAACTYLGLEAESCIMVGDKIETDIKGAIEAGCFSCWIPLNFPAPVENSGDILPDITLSNIYELKTFLIVDEPTLSTTTATTLLQGQSTGGNARSLKLKASRSNSMTNGYPPLTTLSSSSSSSSASSIPNAATGCFSSTKVKSIAPYPKRFLSSPPDLDNDGSNASDGS